MIEPTKTKNSVDLVAVALAINLLVLLAAAIWVYWQDKIIEAQFPFNSFLPAPVTRFGDFFGIGDIWIREKFNGVGYGMSYFPATYLPIDLVTRYFGWPYEALSVALLSGLSLLIFGTDKIVRQTKNSWAQSFLVIVVLLTSYPTIFLIHTGNIEFWLIGSVIVGLWLSKSEKNLLAGVALGVAVAMKIMPIFFIVPFIFRKDLSSIRRTIHGLLIGAVFSTALPLIMYSGGRRDGFGFIDRNRASQQMYLDLMVWGGPGTHFGHSFLNGFHALFGNVLPTRTWWLAVMVIGYSIIAFLYFLQVKSKASLGEVLMVCAVGICLLAPTSTDYKLTAFFPGLIFLLTQTPSRRTYFSTVMCCLIIAPKPYLQTNVCEYCNAGVWLTPILMIFFIVGLYAFNISALFKLDRSLKVVRQSLLSE